jgi:hypothetical protein
MIVMLAPVLMMMGTVSMMMATVSVAVAMLMKNDARRGVLVTMVMAVPNRMQTMA